LPFAQLDVFVNVAGGLRVNETTADLAVAVALASSVHDRPLAADAVFVGEVGLGGEVRPVSQLERRLQEAQRMGFSAAYISARGQPRTNGALRTRGVRRISELFGELFS
jgi:DNA repair protein RadA/Sms